MATPWEKNDQQLDSVRSSAPDPIERRRRLEKALAAVQESGNVMMIESLKAAIEGREATLNLPDIPARLEKL